MVIYGIALLSVCMFIGTYVGDMLGKVLGVDANVGGVGFAMLLLIIGSDYLLKKNMLSEKAKSGIAFWSMMYIPVVVAMAARQDVVAAVKGGPMAILAGIVAVSASFLLIPLLSKIGEPGVPLPSIEKSKGVN